MNSFAKVIMGLSATGCFGAAALYSASSHLDKERQGKLSNRLQETILAIFQTINRNAPKGHINLVSSMSSKSFTHTQEARALAEDERTESHLQGYLFNAVERAKSGTPVFRFQEDKNDFVFSGETGRLFDPKARKAVIGNNYVRCEKSIPTVDKESYSNKDAIIAGTADPDECNQLSYKLLSDAVLAAAINGINPKHPLSDTQVIDYSGGLSRRVGDLTELSKSTKEKITQGNYTLCPRAFYGKTRLSPEKYKSNGMAVVGIREDENPEVCQELVLESIISLTQKIKQG